MIAIWQATTHQNGGTNPSALIHTPPTIRLRVEPINVIDSKMPICQVLLARLEMSDP